MISIVVLEFDRCFMYFNSYIQQILTQLGFSFFLLFLSFQFLRKLLAEEEFQFN